MTLAETSTAPQTHKGGRRQIIARLAALRLSAQLVVGIVLLLLLALFMLLGPFLYDVSGYKPLSVTVGQPPSWQYPLGTDLGGRDMLAVMIVGMPLTLYVGLLAGAIGVLVGALLGFVAAYYGGWADTIIRGLVDIGLTIPPFLVLIVLAMSIQSGMTLTQMGLIIAALAWPWPARTIRSQVLSIRERAYVHIARMSGASGLRIIATELLPNLLPYLAASFVGAVAAAILSSLGLQALGLGATDSPTIGMTIYWAIYYGALLLGMWWWFVPPIVVIVILFLGLYTLSAGLDNIANPRGR